MTGRLPILLLSLAACQGWLDPALLGGQSVPSPYRFFESRQEAGIFIGVTGQGTGRYGYGPKPGLLVGARYGLQLGGPFGLEGVVGYSPTTRDVVDPSRDQNDWVVGEADAELVTADLRLRFSLTGDRTWRGISPSVFLGAGVISELVGLSEVDNLALPDDRFEFGTRFSALFGGGVRWLISRRFLVRGDLALTMFQLKTPRGYLETDRGLAGVGEKQWVSGPTFSLGLGFQF